MRFPGFDGDWKTVKLGDISKFSKGKGISKSDIEEDGATECIRYGELYTHYGEVIGEVKSKTNVDKTTLVLSECNDVIIPASGETQIDIATASCILKSGIALGGDLNIIKTQNDGVFLAYYLSGKKRQEIANLAQGNSVVHLYSSQLSKLFINLPEIEEQKKIGSLLTLIEERIQTQNKIIEELKLLKNIASTKIFSRQAKFVDNNPNIFPNWIPTELSELMSIPEKEKAINIDNKKLLTVKLHLKGAMKNENTDTLSLGSTHYFVRKKGQFIYGKQNLFNGAFAIIPDEFDGFLSSGDVPSLDINTSKINALYLLNYLGRESFYKRLEDLATGSGSKRVHESTLLKVKIELPVIKEQEKIANFFSKIDAKISIESKYLANLKKQKHFLLSNLFI